MRKVAKPPSGFKKLIKDLWDSFVERQHTHKALRLLTSQSWSVEFLTAMMARAAKLHGSPLELELVSKDGQRLIIKTVEPSIGDTYKDDDIMNHLDDEARIRQFMDQVNRRG